MSNSREHIEKHLKNAQELLAARAKLLADKKLDKKQTKRDVTFRKLQAIVRKYAGRLAAFDKVQAVIADVAQRRAEREATPKAPKEKKKRAAAPAPKAKGGGKKEKKA